LVIETPGSGSVFSLKCGIRIKCIGTDQQPSFNPSILEFFNDKVLLLLLLPPVPQVLAVLVKALL
jgi:hypothetical protein